MNCFCICRLLVWQATARSHKGILLLKSFYPFRFNAGASRHNWKAIALGTQLSRPVLSCFL